LRSRLAPLPVERRLQDRHGGDLVDDAPLPVPGTPGLVQVTVGAHGAEPLVHEPYRHGLDRPGDHYSVRARGPRRGTLRTVEAARQAHDHLDRVQPVDVLGDTLHVHR